MFLKKVLKVFFKLVNEWFEVEVKVGVFCVKFIIFIWILGIIVNVVVFQKNSVIIVVVGFLIVNVKIVSII